MYEEATFSVSSSALQEHRGSSKRSSRFGRRFFRNRKSNRKVEDSLENPAENHSDKREQSPTLQLTASNSRDSVSTCSRSKQYGANGVRMEAPLVAQRTRKVLSKPPPASEAAFGGPPRYDWIDIVSARHGFSLSDFTRKPGWFTMVMVARVRRQLPLKSEFCLCIYTDLYIYTDLCI